MVEVGESVIHWNVQGDQVIISVQERAAAPLLVPPVSPPPLNNRTLPEVAAGACARPRPAHPAAGGPGRVRAVAAGGRVRAAGHARRGAHHPGAGTANRWADFPRRCPIGERLLVLPGRYTVTAQRAGYRPLAQTIEVAAGGFRLFELQLEELPGRVSIALQPDVPFRLFVDDVALATDSSGLAEIPGGTRRLRIETDRYLPVEETLAVAGKGQAQQLAYVLQPAWASVRIDSLPAGASVAVDGEPLGVTPLETELLQGERSLVLALEKYKAAVGAAAGPGRHRAAARHVPAATGRWPAAARQ